MPKKKSDPTKPKTAVIASEAKQSIENHESEAHALSFTIETLADPETGKPTQYGRFSCNWQDEEALSSRQCERSAAIHGSLRSSR